MDLGTVEANLKNGEYQSASQFHGDINKIWLNSYAYNEKTSPLYKLTNELEKYYKNMLANEGISKKDKILDAKPRMGSISK
jgi:bromodomain-containing factor 1